MNISRIHAFKPAARGSVASQQASLRFGSKLDEFGQSNQARQQEQKRLKQEQARLQHEKERAEQEQARLQQEKMRAEQERVKHANQDAFFKQRGAQVIASEGDLTITVADCMVDLLEHGKSNIPKLVYKMHLSSKSEEMKVMKLLENAFTALREEGYLVSGLNCEYGVTPGGKESLERVYPAINLPEEGKSYKDTSALYPQRSRRISKHTPGS